jgi:hypothetical protein
MKFSSFLGFGGGVINGRVILANSFYFMSYFQGYNLFSCEKEQQKEKVRNFH